MSNGILGPRNAAKNQKTQQHTKTIIKCENYLNKESVCYVQEALNLEHQSRKWQRINSLFLLTVQLEGELWLPHVREIVYDHFYAT